MRYRWLGLWLGLLLIYAAWRWDYAGRAFWAHCLQHVILHHDGPFLVALAMPEIALLSGFLTSWRRYSIFLTFLKPVIGFLNRPATAVVLFCALNIFWMIPPVHFAAMLDPKLHGMMNGSMVVNGLMFWGLVLNSRALSVGRRIIIMLAVIPPQIVLGMLVFAVQKPVYMAYGICGRAASGMPPLLDQQIGGFILWVPAVMMSIIGVLVVIRREWLRPATRPVLSATD